MKILPATLALLYFPALPLFAQPPQPPRIPNPDIDYRKFVTDARRLESIREKRRLSEEEFLRMAAEPGTIVLDARSAENFSGAHMRGAVNLNLSDFTAGTLARVIPSKTTRVLIYCNNNFAAAPLVLASKSPSASLNLYTFNALASYGYTNVYELGPLIRFSETKLPFVGSEVK